MNRYSISKQPSEVIIDIALKIKTLRKKQKMSQAEFSERSGVSYGSIKRFERTGKVALASLLKMAHVLGRLEDFEKILVDDRKDELDNLFSDKTRR